MINFRTVIKRDALLKALNNLERCEKNPILSPNETFADYALYNGDVIFHDGIFHAALRCERTIGDGRTTSAIGYYTSRDGYHFEPALQSPVISEEGLSIDDPRIFHHDSHFYIASTQVQSKPRIKQTLHLVRTQDFERFELLGTLPLREGEPYADFKGIRAFVPVADEKKKLAKINGRHFGYCYHTLPNGTGVIFCFILEDINDPESYVLASKEPVMTPRPGSWDGNLVEPGPPPILTDRSILMVYAGENKYRGAYSVGIAEFDPENPTRLINCQESAILMPQEWYETELAEKYKNCTPPRDGGIVFPNGLCLTREKLFLYYGGGDQCFCVAKSDF